MVREFEFRGLSEETSKWLFGNLVKIGDYYHILSQKEKEEPSNSNRVFEDSIREFTGFYDMDNNKIFERDIIEVHLFGGKPFKTQVKWDIINLHFYFEPIDSETNKNKTGVEPTNFYFNIFDSKKSLKVINNDTQKNN